MNTLLKSLAHDTSAATAIEYGLIVALIALAIIGALMTVGGASGTGGLWQTVEEETVSAMNRSP